ncbi:MAG TPA: hypothetical protein DHW64_06380 [Chitinophagaceae bacterium]|nr:hypothetical protein [Chitinophagaceae bacterium]
MKKIIFIIAMLFFRFSVFAQAQELEQLKINLEKLLQLKLMLAQAKQGYQTLTTGYNAVRDVTKGNFDLHRKQLDLLLVVGDKVRSSPAIQRSLTNYRSVEQEVRGWMQLARSLGLFNAKELDEMNQDFLLVSTQGKEDKETLSLVLSNGTLRMSDAERLALVEMLSSNSEQCLALVREKVKAQTAISVARAQAKKDREAMRRLYGL